MAAANPDALGRLHALTARLHEAMTLEAGAANGATGAAAAYSRQRGVCQDFVNVFVSVARGFGAPSRVVSGYLRREDAGEADVAGHAWAEGFVEKLGWVGFDPTCGFCPGESYVRVAIGLNSLDAAPVRGAHVGGDGERVEVKLRVEAARNQRQS